jgi:hypothetical protein
MIGFLAKRKRGKDTACDYLVSEYGYTKRGFADPLKLGVQQWFQFSDEQLHTDKKEENDINWGISPRHVYQVVGTDIVRELFSKILLPNIGNDFWIKSADIWYENNKSIHEEKVVWCDVRFQNEVDYILNKGGVVYRIDRPSLNLEENYRTDNHMSEKSIDCIKNYTDIIINDGSLHDFYTNIEKLINK